MCMSIAADKGVIHLHAIFISFFADKDVTNVLMKRVSAAPDKHMTSSD